MSQNNPKKTDLGKAKELGLSQEQINQFLSSTFDDIEDWNTATAAGFDEYTEWIDAKKGGFPTRADWILATYKGYKTYAEYKHLKKPTGKTDTPKSTTNLEDQKTFNAKHAAESKPVITNNKPSSTPTHHVPELTLRADIDEPRPASPTLVPQQKNNADTLLQNVQPTSPESQSIPTNTTFIPDNSSSSIAEQSSKSYGQQDLKVETGEEIFSHSVTTTRAPPLYINPTEFIDNPQLERIYRLAEVLYETKQVQLNDLTEALNFDDLIDVEEWLGEIFQPNQYFISLDHQIIMFQDGAYDFIFNYLNNIHSLNEV